jgi:hypothetical protein
MSYWLEDADGNYLCDLASNRGLAQLQQRKDMPHLVAFLGAGQTDDVQAVIEDTQGDKATEYIAKVLKGAKAPVFITDGCGSIEQKGDEP